MDPNKKAFIDKTAAVLKLGTSEWTQQESSVVGSLVLKAAMYLIFQPYFGICFLGML